MYLFFILFGISSFSIIQGDKVEISIQKLSDNVKEMKKIITNQALFLNQNRNNIDKMREISNNIFEHGVRTERIENEISRLSNEIISLSSILEQSGKMASEPFQKQAFLDIKNDMQIMWNTIEIAQAHIDGHGRLINNLSNRLIRQENARINSKDNKEHIKRDRNQNESRNTDLFNTSMENRLDHLEEIEKITALRSCSEYKNQGIDTSGNFMIDPDGLFQGVTAFMVFCNFEADTTEVEHDHEKLVDIPHCEGAMCFNMKIRYKPQINQLEALINSSESCTQGVRFGCIQAPLAAYYPTKYVGVWTNRFGVEEFYFTASNSGVHVCDCGLKNNCSEAGFMCNCDSATPDLQEDEGTITNMTALPITGFRYGKLEAAGQRAFIEIGRLKCKGGKPREPKSLKRDCRDMDRSESFSSFNFPNNVNNDELCKFRSLYEDLLAQQEIDQPSPNKTKEANKVMFVATIDRSFYYYIPVGVITFDNVLVDLGTDFDALRGEFTAPRNGTYLFMVDGTLRSESRSAQIDLIVNDGIIRQFSENNNADVNYHKSIIGVFALGLNSGDVVKINNRNSETVHVNIHYPFRFMGVLISDDISDQFK